jgi:hypothetical protein
MSGQTARLNKEVKRANVPNMPEPVVRDTQNGPPLSAMDNAVAETPHIICNFTNDNCVNLCVVNRTILETLVHPFVHPVVLRGEMGSVVGGWPVR